jgi:hypothetical protein
LLNRRTHNAAQSSLVVFFLKVTAASAAMGFACFEATNYLDRYFDLRHIFNSLAVLVIVTLAGVILLWVFLKILGVSEADSYLKRSLGFLRRNATTGASATS